MGHHSAIWLAVVWMASRVLHLVQRRGACVGEHPVHFSSHTSQRNKPSRAMSAGLTRWRLHQLRPLTFRAISWSIRCIPAYMSVVGCDTNIRDIITLMKLFSCSIMRTLGLITSFLQYQIRFLAVWYFLIFFFCISFFLLLPFLVNKKDVYI